MWFEGSLTKDPIEVTLIIPIRVKLSASDEWNVACLPLWAEYWFDLIAPKWRKKLKSSWLIMFFLVGYIPPGQFYAKLSD